MTRGTRSLGRSIRQLRTTAPEDGDIDHFLTGHRGHRGHPINIYQDLDIWRNATFLFTRCLQRTVTHSVSAQQTEEVMQMIRNVCQCDVLRGVLNVSMPVQLIFLSDGVD